MARNDRPKPPRDKAARRPSPKEPNPASTYVEELTAEHGAELELRRIAHEQRGKPASI
jgi:hypothetical protein